MSLLTELENYFLNFIATNMSRLWRWFFVPFKTEEFLSPSKYFHHGSTEFRPRQK
jgi:hypothetical protein